MPRCPSCGKGGFTNHEAISRHMSQPKSGCSTWFGDLVHIREDLLSRDPDGHNDLHATSINKQSGGRDEYDSMVGSDEQMLDRTQEGNSHSSLIKHFPGAMQFNADKFSNHWSSNIYYPFASRGDWELGLWLLHSGLSMGVINAFLSFHLIHFSELLPSRPCWKSQEIHTSHLTKRPVLFYWHGSLELLQFLFNNPEFQNVMDLSPYRLYDSATCLYCIYMEWMSGEDAWSMRSQIPVGATLLGTILSSDKTNILVLTGDCITHPLLISLTNIKMATRLKLSSHMFLLTTLLLIPKFIHKNKQMKGVLEACLIHQCLDIVLEPLKQAAKLGVMMSDPWASKADPSDIEIYFRKAQKFCLNGVDKPFWHDIPLSCPSRLLTPEILHHIHKEFRDHNVKWCINALGSAEIDFRFSVLQPVTGLCHFKEGISTLKQVMGRTLHDIQHFIVGVIAGCAPHDVVIAIWALMDCCYHIQAYHIMDRDIEAIHSALHQFHLHKHSILDAGLHHGKANKPINNWHIPKLELMQSVVPSIARVGVSIQWSADLTKHAHIEQIKDPARGSNNNNYDPQICWQLDCLEKCRNFDLAMSFKDRGLQWDGSDLHGSSQPIRDYFAHSLQLASSPLDTIPLPHRAFSVGCIVFNLAYNPSICEKIHSMDAVHSIGGGPHRAIGNVVLPFEDIQMVEVHTHSVLPVQTILASLPKGDWQYGRYDSVVVNTDSTKIWPASGLQAGACHDPASQMHILRRAMQSCGQCLGDVIPVSQIRAYANLILHFGQCADTHLTSLNSFEHCWEFFLNKYFDKNSYYPLLL
ncbi:hypothetical protein EDC04DRAFT_2871206 [Pisolithus marmoratus]|nr:hypothetical protein EDC04DRAFT_2871206 [Pisolithus marmoratus]